MMLQNWYEGGMNDMEQNPYWLLNRTPNQDERYRTIVNLSVKYQFNDLFSLAARGSADFIADKSSQTMYAGTRLSGCRWQMVVIWPMSQQP